MHLVFRFAECHQVAHRPGLGETGVLLTQNPKLPSQQLPAQWGPSLDAKPLEEPTSPCSPLPSQVRWGWRTLSFPLVPVLGCASLRAESAVAESAEWGEGAPSCLAWSPEEVLRVSAPETGVGSLAGHWLCDLEPSPVWVWISHLGNGNPGQESPSCMQLRVENLLAFTCWPGEQDRGF